MRIGGQQRTKRRRSILVKNEVDRLTKLLGTNRSSDDVEMDRAQYDVVRLIPRPNILEVASVGFRPLVVLTPDDTGIAACGLDERNEPICVQIIDLAINELEVRRIQMVYI